MMRAILGGMMVAAALAACGDQGGELAEDTARRRASESGADSAGESVGDSVDAAPGRMAAFVLTDSSPVTLPAAPAAADSAPVAAAPAPGQPPAAPQEAWTAGVTDRVRTMPRPVTLGDVRVQDLEELLPVVAGQPLFGRWQSLVLVDSNADNPVRNVRLSFLEA